MKGNLRASDFKSVEQEFIYDFSRSSGKNNSYSCAGIDGYKVKWVAVYISSRHV
jgi:hypothetical protein